MASSTESYRALLRLAPARRLVYALTAACLTFGMVPLTILLTVQRATGSYPDGGYAVAAFGLTAGASAPFRGRLVDRRGMRTWLPLMAGGYGATLIALDLVGLASGPTWALVALAGLAGISAPPLFASARSLWPHAVEAALVRRGYAITSLISDVGQVAGPALAGVLFVFTDWTALLVCAAAALLAAALCVTGADAPSARARPRPMPKLFESRALVGLLVVSILLGAAVGLVQVAVPTIAGAVGLGLACRAAPRSVRPWQRGGRALVREPQLAAVGPRSLPVLGARARAAARAGRARLELGRPRQRSSFWPDSPSARRPCRCSKASTCSRQAAAPRH